MTRLVLFKALAASRFSEASAPRKPVSLVTYVSTAVFEEVCIRLKNAPDLNSEDPSDGKMKAMQK
jgi:hypothetical protein